MTIIVNTNQNSNGMWSCIGSILGDEYIFEERTQNMAKIIMANKIKEVQEQNNISLEVKWSNPVSYSEHIKKAQEVYSLMNILN